MYHLVSSISLFRCVFNDSPLAFCFLGFFLCKTISHRSPFPFPLIVWAALVVELKLCILVFKSSCKFKNIISCLRLVKIIKCREPMSIIPSIDWLWVYYLESADDGSHNRSKNLNQLELKYTSEITINSCLVLLFVPLTL